MNPIIEFVIPTYKRYDSLNIIINSIIVQTYDNWKLHIISDGKDERTDEIMNRYIHKNIKYSTIEGPNGSWGHPVREYGLMSSESDWIVMSGDDNYYMPVFVEEFTNAILSNNNIGFVHCNLIHNGFHKTMFYQELSSDFEEGSIDMGNVMTKTELSKKIGFKSRSYIADWEFIDSYKKEYEKNYIFYKIHKVLYVHN